MPRTKFRANGTGPDRRRAVLIQAAAAESGALRRAAEACDPSLFAPRPPGRAP